MSPPLFPLPLGEGAKVPPLMHKGAQMGRSLLVSHATEPPGVEHLGSRQCRRRLRSASNHPRDRRNGPARISAPDVDNSIDLVIVEQQRGLGPAVPGHIGHLHRRAHVKLLTQLRR